MAVYLGSNKVNVFGGQPQGGDGGGSLFDDFKTIVEGTGGTQSNPTTVTIPEGVTTIKQRIFLLYEGHISIVLPSTLTSISAYVFSGTQGSIHYITVKAEVPPNIDSTTFNNCYPNAIYVPSGSVGAYKSASGWSAKASIIQAIPE